MKVQVHIDVTEQELSDIIITAVEGGINYWARVKNYKCPEGGLASALVVADDAQAPVPWAALTIQSVARGLQICSEKYPHVFAKWLSDRIGDASDADVIVQCAIFGEAVYG